MDNHGDRHELLVTLTADIVSAHVGGNDVETRNIASLIATVHDALAGIYPDENEEQRPEPAVSIRASIKPDHLVCLEDGKKLKMMKRHLMTRYGLTPEQYRAKWDLPADYPMVAPAYAETRRKLAKKIGLGTKRPRP